MKWIGLFAVIAVAVVVGMLATDGIRAKRDAPDQMQRLNDALKKFDEADRAVRGLR